VLGRSGDGTVRTHYSETGAGIEAAAGGLGLA
jgi:hypothetical protein